VEPAVCSANATEMNWLPVLELDFVVASLLSVGPGSGSFLHCRVITSLGCEPEQDPYRCGVRGWGH
jgi:hypothetical protein